MFAFVSVRKERCSFFFFCRAQTNFWVNLMNVAFFYIWYSLSFYVSISFSAVYSVGPTTTPHYTIIVCFGTESLWLWLYWMFHCFPLPPTHPLVHCILYTIPWLSAYLLSQRQTITSMLYVSWLYYVFGSEQNYKRTMFTVKTVHCTFCTQWYNGNKCRGRAEKGTTKNL